MKQILTIAFTLIGSVMFAQDTLCVMICQDEIINFNYDTSDIINRFDHTGKYEIKINNGEVLCLHLNDEQKRFREVKVKFNDGEQITNVFNSFDNVLYTKENWGSAVVFVSECKRKR